jgi:hypothetical protein
VEDWVCLECIPTGTILTDFAAEYECTIPLSAFKDKFLDSSGKALKLNQAIEVSVVSLNKFRSFAME